MRRFLIVSLCIYGVGAALSQSLMSFGGTLVVIAFFIGLGTSFKERRFSDLSKCEKISIFTGLFFVALSLIHLLWVRDPSQIPEALKNLPLFLVPLAALFPLNRRNLNDKDLKNIILVTAVAYLVSCVYSISMVALGHTGRAVGFFGNPIFYAYNLLAALSFFVYLATRNPQLVHGMCPIVPGLSKRLFHYLLSLLLLITLTMTSSRTASATGLLVWLFYVATAPSKYRKYVLGSGLLLISLSSVTLYQTSPKFKGKMRNILRGRLFKDRSWQGRLTAWEHNWNLVQTNPLLGVGYQQNYIDSSDSPELKKHWKPGFHIYAHSIYLQSLAESGFVGSGLLLASYGTFVAQSPASLPLAAALLMGGSTENIFNNSKAAHAFFFFLLLAGLVSQSTKRWDEAADLNSSDDLPAHQE